MRIILSISIAAVLLAATPAYAQFELDRSPADIRRQMSTPALIDLAVGEIGLMSGVQFCVGEGQRLFVYANSPLSTTRTEYGINWEAKREPGGLVGISGLPGSKSDTTVAKAVAQQMVDVRACGGEIFPGEKVLPVSTINGETTLSGLIR